MAPEITLTRKYSNKIDVFSFAIINMHCVFFEDNLPYKNNKGGSDIGNVELKVANDPSYRPMVNNEKVNSSNKWYIELMKKAWNANPNTRPSFEKIMNIFTKKGFSVEEKKKNSKMQKKGIFKPKTPARPNNKFVKKKPPPRPRSSVKNSGTPKKKAPPRPRSSVKAQKGNGIKKKPPPRPRKSVKDSRK